MTDPLRLALALGPEELERLADALAPLVAARLAAAPTTTASPYLTVPEAAAYLRASRQRVHDLCSQGRLPQWKDGRRSLLHRDDLDRYLAGEGAPP